MITWLKTLDKDDVTYWVGMGMLFLGLTLRVSIATALVVTGAVIAAEAVITSYLTTWLAFKSERK